MLAGHNFRAKLLQCFRLPAGWVGRHFRLPKERLNQLNSVGHRYFPAHTPPLDPRPATLDSAPNLRPNRRRDNLGGRSLPLNRQFVSGRNRL